MVELRCLFAGFLKCSRLALLNLDDPVARALAVALPAGKAVGYGLDSPQADLMGKALELHGDGVSFALEADGERYDVRLQVPGRHNASNALAAIAAARALGVRIEDAVNALARFEGLKRRLETVGTAGGVTVIDDFAHNPDKIDATLATLRAQPGRLLLMFQPHGYGPLARMGEELAASLAGGMAPGDRLYLPDPVYLGGTTERVHGSDRLAGKVREGGGEAEHIAERAKIGEALLAEARSGDRVVIMGARDDTLIDFARELVERLSVPSLRA
jgi:UDP-N-acetylmuramate--alanine ligase